MHVCGRELNVAVIHQLHKHVFESSLCVPGPGLEAEDQVVKKTHQVPVLRLRLQGTREGFKADRGRIMFTLQCQ